MAAIGVDHDEVDAVAGGIDQSRGRRHLLQDDAVGCDGSDEPDQIGMRAKRDPLMPNEAQPDAGGWTNGGLVDVGIDVGGSFLGCDRRCEQIGPASTSRYRCHQQASRHRGAAPGRRGALRDDRRTSRSARAVHRTGGEVAEPQPVSSVAMTRPISFLSDFGHADEFV